MTRVRRRTTLTTSVMCLRAILFKLLAFYLGFIQGIMALSSLPISSI